MKVLYPQLPFIMCTDRDCNFSKQIEEESLPIKSKIYPKISLKPPAKEYIAVGVRGVSEGK